MSSQTLSHSRLTPAVHRQIVSAIRSGAYPHVAAQACDVSKELFDDWLRRGTGPYARKPYGPFAREVLQAQAQARVRAETEAFANAPKAWLHYGPGRESTRSPGWSAPVKASALTGEDFNAFLDPRLMEFLRDITAALVNFPEARQQTIEVAQKHSLLPRKQAA